MEVTMRRGCDMGNLEERDHKGDQL